jgi:2-hydroxychromene-2-carboxylate isomerase
LLINEQQEISGSPAAIELWFEFGSSYSYLSVMRIEQAAAWVGVTIHSVG